MKKGNLCGYRETDFHLHANILHIATVSNDHFLLHALYKVQRGNIQNMTRTHYNFLCVPTGIFYTFVIDCKFNPFINDTDYFALYYGNKHSFLNIELAFTL